MPVHIKDVNHLARIKINVVLYTKKSERRNKLIT